VWPLVFAISTLASWALPPPERRLAAVPAIEMRPIESIVPIVIAIVMVVVSILTLPEDAPTF
jgi:hypothetical protein